MNAKGIYDYENWIENWVDVFTVELTAPEYDLLWEVFHEWNEEFGILIDLFEEDTLVADNTERAMEILKKHMETDERTVFISAANKLKSALERAIEVHMPLHLDF